MRLSVLLLVICLVMKGLCDDSQFVFGTGYYNNTMKWGSYRPQVIFGMKTRHEDTLMTGFMWHNAEDPRS
jgi:hypothetical protein